MPTRVTVAALLAAICATVVAGATAAPTALPQQSGVVDLLTQANVRIDGATAAEQVGYSAEAGDVNGDGLADVILGAPFASNNGRMHSGSAYVVFGSTSTATVDLAAPGARGFRIDGAGSGDFVASVSGAGDVNGDGRADVLVGAPLAGDNGAAYVVFGKTDTVRVDLAALGARGFRIDGAATFDNAGHSVAGVGDVNGDGRPDVLVGAPVAGNNGRADSGSAYVVFGKTSTTSVDLAALGAGGYRIDGAAGSDDLGGSVAGAGDVNGDGRPDVLLGARFADNNTRTDSGSAYVVFGKTSTTSVDLAALGAGGYRIDGGAASDSAGEAVSGAGDVNGDGRPDVLVGARGADNNARNASGSGYVVFGKASTDPVDLSMLGAGGFRIDGGAASDSAGEAVSGAGDVNGDGRPDLFLGASNADNNGRDNSGSAYVVFGKTSTTAVDLATLGAGGFRIDGAFTIDLTGQAVGGVGDLNGDGREDVLVGVHAADHNGRTDSGSGYVVFGFGQPQLAYNTLSGTVGQTIAPHAPTQLRRTGTPSFQVAPALPAGLSFDAATGVVTGTPTAVQAQTTHTVTLTDLAGQATAPLLVTVVAPAPPPDRTRPRLTLSFASPQRALRQKRIVLRARCNEPCTLRAQGSIVFRGIRALVALQTARSTRLTTAQRTLSLKLTKSAQRRLARFLAKKRKATAVVGVRATDRAGNKGSASRGIKIRR